MAKKIDGLINQYTKLASQLENQVGTLEGLTDKEVARATQVMLNSERQRVINELLKEQNNLTGDQLKKLAALIGEQDKINENERKINSSLDKNIEKRKRIVDIGRSLNSQLQIGIKYLSDSDKLIKKTILNLGMSGAKAALMRDAFNGAAGYAERLGAGIEGISLVMQGYADETGKARVLSSEMVKDIIDIGKGTGIGIEAASKLGGQFELMGLDARATTEYVQGIVDTTERMGVNTSKVLLGINSNFKRLNTYTFQRGVRGIADMASYSEKFRTDINQTLNAIDIAKTLEGAIDMVANLQVMGGEFAKMDMHQTLYLARNDAEKFNEQISQMTKGLVSYREVTDKKGKTFFETFISPADRDRIASVAKSMGMTTESFTEMAQRRLEMDTMTQQLAGTGLNDIQKEWIKGASIFNSETKKFQVQVGGHYQDIASLTSGQAESFVQEQKLLSERAKEAQTFDEVFKTTINELKSALLPLLKGINKVLTNNRDWIIKVTEYLTSGSLGWLKVAGAFTAGTILLKGIVSPLIGKLGEATVGRMATAIGGAKVPEATGSISGLAEQRRGIGAGAAARGAGMKALGTGVGVGAAGAGMGAGVMLAAKGIAELAEAMSKLSPEQANALALIGTTLAITFPLAAVGILLAGKAATVSAVGLLALGAAVALVGGGIFLATTGIGNMAEGLGNMIDKSKGAGDAMLNVGLGVGALSLAMMGFSAGALGLGIFALTMNTIAKHAPSLEKVGNAFANIKAVMSGTKEDFTAVENAVKSISNMNMGNGGMLAELATLLKTPLKVEFGNKDIIIRNNITLDIDGYEFTTKVINVPALIHKMKYLPEGK